MKNLLGFVKENKKTIGMIIGAMASVIVAKKVVKSICLKACKMISSAPLPILVFLMGCLQQRAIVLNGDGSPQGEKAADFILIFPTLFLWKKLYKIS